ncbi:hypothetical protein, partial [Escherichia coli]|uniref:hypothetical protein n=1 Tax=Escherichia coli TaxID=562 RepID=UPI003B223257
NIAFIELTRSFTGGFELFTTTLKPACLSWAISVVLALLDFLESPEASGVLYHVMANGDADMLKIVLNALPLLIRTCH